MGSAWKWNDQRRQFYLHQFKEKQPDLNLRDGKLKKEITVVCHSLLLKYLYTL